MLWPWAKTAMEGGRKTTEKNAESIPQGQQQMVDLPMKNGEQFRSYVGYTVNNS